MIVRRVYLLYVCLISLMFSCSVNKIDGRVNNNDVLVKDSVIVYSLPPQNHYLVRVNEVSIKKMEGVTISKSAVSSVFKRLRDIFINEIDSKVLKDYDNVDARVLVVFKSDEGEERVLINKFGFFYSNGVVYDGSIAISSLQEAFPNVLFIKDIK